MIKTYIKAYMGAFGKRVSGVNSAFNLDFYSNMLYHSLKLRKLVWGSLAAKRIYYTYTQLNKIWIITKAEPLHHVAVHQTESLATEALLRDLLDQAQVEQKAPQDLAQEEVLVHQAQEQVHIDLQEDEALEDEVLATEFLIAKAEVLEVLDQATQEKVVEEETEADVVEEAEKCRLSTHHNSWTKTLLN